MENKGIFEFGPFVLDSVSKRLLRGEQPVTLTPKVFETLQVLVRNSGRVLSKEEMMKAIWPDRFVEEANLTQNISVLRRALGEAESGTKYIATFPGKGYQFIGAVRVAGAEPVPPPAPRLRGRLWMAVAAVLALGAAVAAFMRTGDHAAPALRRTPLTRFPGAEYHPAISRQGTKLAFVWDKENPTADAVFVKGPEDDSPRPLSTGPFNHSSPAWSPDGRFVAYLRHEPEATKVIIKPERGGDEREVASLFPSRYGLICRHLDWSPDGKTLAVDDKSSPNEPFGIFLVDVGSGARRRLSKADTDIIGDVDPRFSPDGKTVSFVRMVYRFTHELFVVPVAGGKPRQLTRDEKQIGGHDWLPNGDSILFSSDRSGDFAIWKIDAAGGSEVVPAGISGFSPIQLSIARTGSRLVYSEFQQDLNIWRLDIPKSDDAGQAAWTRVVASTGEDILPQLSPDGKRICFRSNRSGEDQLWIAGADGAEPVQLTRGALRPAMGRWSPDGKYITFNSAVVQTMYVIEAGGGVPRTLTFQGGHPTFSSDGRAVYFSDGGAILSMELPAGPATVLTASGGFPKIPARDGKHLFYVPGRTATAIWRLALGTRQTEKVLDGLLPGYWGAWTVSSRGIYYLSKDPATPDGAAVLFQSFDAGRPVRIAHFPGPLPPIGTSTWSISPDERYLYCVRADRSHSDVVMVEGFR